jgi:uncharacterized repeat protein (TIGR01451 family)
MTTQTLKKSLTKGKLAGLVLMVSLSAIFSFSIFSQSVDTNADGNPYLNTWLTVFEANDEVQNGGNGGNFCTNMTPFSYVPNNLVEGTSFTGPEYDPDAMFCSSSVTRIVDPGDELILNINVPGGNYWNVEVWYFSDIGTTIEAEIGNDDKSSYAPATNTPGIQIIGQLNVTETGVHPVVIKNDGLGDLRLGAVFVQNTGLLVPDLEVSKEMVGFDDGNQIDWDALPYGTGAFSNKKIVTYELEVSASDGNIVLEDVEVTDEFDSSVYTFVSSSHLPTQEGANDITWTLDEVEEGNPEIIEVTFAVEDPRDVLNCNDYEYCGEVEVENLVIADAPSDMAPQVEDTHTVEYYSPERFSNLVLTNYELDAASPLMVNSSNGQSNGSITQEGTTEHTFDVTNTPVGQIGVDAINVGIYFSEVNSTNGGGLLPATVTNSSASGGKTVSYTNGYFIISEVESNETVTVTFDATYSTLGQVPTGEVSTIRTKTELDDSLAIGNLNINDTPLFAETDLIGEFQQVFEITKSANPTNLTVMRGYSNDIAYQITVTNTTSIPRVARVVDTLPTGPNGVTITPYTNVPGFGGVYNSTNHTITWNNINLAPGQTSTINFSVEVSASTTAQLGATDLVNSVDVFEGNILMDSASVVTALTVIASADALIVEKNIANLVTCNQFQFYLNGDLPDGAYYFDDFSSCNFPSGSIEVVPYRIEWTWTGSNPLTNVTLEDVLPNGLTCINYPYASTSIYDHIPCSQISNYNIGTLNGGASGEAILLVEVPIGNINIDFENEAIITGEDSINAVSFIASDTATFSLKPQSKIAITSYIHEFGDGNIVNNTPYGPVNPATVASSFTLTNIAMDPSGIGEQFAGMVRVKIEDLTNPNSGKLNVDSVSNVSVSEPGVIAFYDVANDRFNVNFSQSVFYPTTNVTINFNVEYESFNQNQSVDIDSQVYISVEPAGVWSYDDTSIELTGVMAVAGVPEVILTNYSTDASSVVSNNIVGGIVQQTAVQAQSFTVTYTGVPGVDPTVDVVIPWNITDVVSNPSYNGGDVSVNISTINPNTVTYSNGIFTVTGLAPATNVEVEYDVTYNISLPVSNPIPANEESLVETEIYISSVSNSSVQWSSDNMQVQALLAGEVCEFEISNYSISYPESYVNTVSGVPQLTGVASHSFTVTNLSTFQNVNNLQVFIADIVNTTANPGYNGGRIDLDSVAVLSPPGVTYNNELFTIASLNAGDSKVITFEATYELNAFGTGYYNVPNHQESDIMTDVGLIPLTGVPCGDCIYTNTTDAQVGVLKGMPSNYFNFTKEDANGLTELNYEVDQTVEYLLGFDAFSYTLTDVVVSDTLPNGVTFVSYDFYTNGTAATSPVFNGVNGQSFSFSFNQIEANTQGGLLVTVSLDWSVLTSQVGSITNTATMTVNSPAESQTATYNHTVPSGNGNVTVQVLDVDNGYYGYIGGDIFFDLNYDNGSGAVSTLFNNYEFVAPSWYENFTNRPFGIYSLSDVHTTNTNLNVIGVTGTSYVDTDTLTAPQGNTIVLTILVSEDAYPNGNYSKNVYAAGSTVVYTGGVDLSLLPGQFDYAIEWSMDSTGNISYQDFRIEDELPNGLTYVSYETTSNVNFSQNGQNLEFNFIDPVGPNNSGSIVVRVDNNITQTQTGTYTISNTAEFYNNQTYLGEDTADFTYTYTYNPNVNVFIAKTVFPDNHTFEVGTMPANLSQAYTITATNTGVDAISGLTIVDTLPQQINPTNVTATQGGQYNNYTVTWSNVYLAGNSAWSATVNAFLDPADFPNVGTYTVTNTVMLSGTGLPAVSAFADTEVIVTGPNPVYGLEVDKNISAYTAQSGDTVTYTLDITNNDYALDFRLFDTIGNNDDGFIPGTNGGGVSYAGNFAVSGSMGVSVNGSIADSTGLLVTGLGPNESISISYTAVASGVENIDTTITNMVTATELGGTVLDTGSASLIITGEYDLGVSYKKRRSSRRSYFTYIPPTPYYYGVAEEFAVVKTVSPELIQTGQEATYTISIKNLTSNYRTIGLYDTIGGLNDNMIIGTDGGNAKYVNNSLMVSGATFTGSLIKDTGMTLYDVAPNGNVVITYKVAGYAPDNTTSYIANDVSLFTGTQDTATLVVKGNVVSPAVGGMNIDKYADKNIVNPGDIVEYTLMVRNNGTDNAGYVNVYDALPKGLDFVSSPDPSVMEENGNLRVDIGDLAPGQSKMIKYFAKVDETSKAGDLLENVAQLTYRNSDNIVQPSIFARELVKVGSVFFLMFLGIMLFATAVVRLVRKAKTA